MPAFKWTLLGMLCLNWSLAQAEVVFESISWPRSDSISVRLVIDGEKVKIDGNLPDGATVVVSTEEMITVEFKSYKDPLFLMLAITTEDSDDAAVFLLESKFLPGSTSKNQKIKWEAINDKAITARRLDLMKDFEGIIKAFETVANFGVPQAFRKMGEYFAQYPDRRLLDVYDGLEKKDPFLVALTKPKINLNSGNQGVVQQDVPDQNVQRQDNTQGGNPDEDLYLEEAEAIRQAEAKRKKRNQQRRQRQSDYGDQDPYQPRRYSPDDFDSPGLW